MFEENNLAEIIEEDDADELDVPALIEEEF